MTEVAGRVISNHGGTLIVEVEEGLVLKAGHRVHPAERFAMELVRKRTTAPVPEPLLAKFGPKRGEILMPLVPGVCLKDVWGNLDAQTKTSICKQIWNFVEEWKCIPKPLGLQHLYQCSVEGKSGSNSLITNFDRSVQKMKSNIFSDEDLRQRICDNYYDAFGRRYTKAQLFDMLPRSDNPSVFTHGDLRPKNIMVSRDGKVTGIIDWETAGWYPEYWEHIGIMSPPFMDGDWEPFMTACAPQTWDLEGIVAARRVLH